MSDETARLRRLAAELAGFDAARATDPAAAWRSLERAHILAQQDMGPHAAVHLRMLRYALHRGDWREGLGQLVRLMLVPLGNATGRLPVGNTGRANVSAFRQMPIPSDLLDVLDAEGRGSDGARDG